MADSITGHCMCGQLRYAAPAKPLWTALCHCESCRRATSGPVVAWMGFGVEKVIWQGERRFYKSSDIATRGFCPVCGSQMSFESTRWPGEIHLYGVSRDDPDAYAPDLHCHTAERLPWLVMNDDLPRYTRSAGQEEGEG